MKAFIVIVLFAFVTRGFCRPNGAPSEACTQLIPQHPPSVPLAGTGPYTLDVQIPSVGYLSGNGYERTCEKISKRHCLLRHFSSSDTIKQQSKRNVQRIHCPSKNTARQRYCGVLYSGG